MKNKKRRVTSAGRNRAISWLLTLAMLFTLVPAMAISASAATSYDLDITSPTSAVDVKDGDFLSVQYNCVFSGDTGNELYEDIGSTFSIHLIETSASGTANKGEEDAYLEGIVNQGDTSFDFGGTLTVDSVQFGSGSKKYYKVELRGVDGTVFAQSSKVTVNKAAVAKTDVTLDSSTVGVFVNGSPFTSGGDVTEGDVVSFKVDLGSDVNEGTVLFTMPDGTFVQTTVQSGLAAASYTVPEYTKAAERFNNAQKLEFAIQYYGGANYNPSNEYSILTGVLSETLSSASAVIAGVSGTTLTTLTSYSLSVAGVTDTAGIPLFKDTDYTVTWFVDKNTGSGWEAVTEFRPLATGYKYKAVVAPIGSYTSGGFELVIGCGETIDTTTVLEENEDSQFEGQKLVLTAAVNDQQTPTTQPASGGTVNFFRGDIYLGFAPVVNGAATLETVMPSYDAAQSVTFYASYSGNNVYGASSDSEGYEVEVLDATLPDVVNGENQAAWVIEVTDEDDLKNGNLAPGVEYILELDENFIPDDLVYDEDYYIEWQVSSDGASWSHLGYAETIDVTPPDSTYRYRAVIFPKGVYNEPLNGYPSNVLTCGDNVFDTEVALSVSNTTPYEKVEEITLTAAVTYTVDSVSLPVSGGSVTFTGTDGYSHTMGLDSAGYASVTIPAPAYGDGDDGTYEYAVEYSGTNIYGEAEDDVEVTPKSATLAFLSFVMEETNYYSEDGALAVYAGTATSGDIVSMVAGNQYTLVLPTVYTMDGTTLTVGENYVVYWEYAVTNNGTTSWYAYPTASQFSDTLTVDTEQYGLIYRAKVLPYNGFENKILLGSLTANMINPAETNEVAVSVTASAATVYQSNPITLYAAVTPSSGATAPTGTVAFYYTNKKTSGNYTGETWTLIQADDIKVDSYAIPLVNNGGSVSIASITTSALPVRNAANNGTARTLVFKAVYSGDSVFEAGDNTATGESTMTVASDNVTVYSSVVDKNSVAVTATEDTETFLTLGQVTTMDGIAGVDSSYSGSPAYAKLAINSDYTVQWQYRNTNMLGSDDWQVVSDASVTQCLIEPLQGYQYRAMLTVSTDSAKVKASYNEVSSPVAGAKVYYCDPVTFSDSRYVTTTSLTVSDSTPYETVDQITLTAVVNYTDNNGNAYPVKTGTVTFGGAGVGGTADTVTVAVNSGVATVTFDAPAYYGAGTDETPSNEYTYTAQYNGAENYLKSEESTVTVTPLSATLAFKANDQSVVPYTATTAALIIYEGTDLTAEPVDSMVAGQQYTLKLPVVYSQDGTPLTVSTNYTVDWEYLVDSDSQASNTETSWLTYPGSGNSDTLTVDTGTYGITYRAVVKPNANDHANRILLGALTASTGSAIKNDVTVAVTSEVSSNVITDKENDKAYQANPITLHATVTPDFTDGVGVAAPTGSVAFYYTNERKNGNYSGVNWTLVQADDDTVVNDKIPLENHNGTYMASITTSTLPVKKADGTARTLVFKAVYSGDSVFEDGDNLTDGDSETFIDSDDVTVYSSVVEEESVAITAMPADDDDNKTYLVLGQVTTLDGIAEDEEDEDALPYSASPDFAKLTINSDYTVQWQYRNTNSPSDNGWRVISDASVTQCLIEPLQGYQYRAVLTVSPTSEKVKASYKELKTPTVPVSGAQVYYSNVLTFDDNRYETTTLLTVSDPTPYETVDKITLTAVVKYTDNNGYTYDVKSGTVTFTGVGVGGTVDTYEAPVNGSGVATVTFVAPDYYGAGTDDQPSTDYTYTAYYSGTENYKPSYGYSVLDDEETQADEGVLDIVVTPKSATLAFKGDATAAPYTDTTAALIIYKGVGTDGIIVNNNGMIAGMDYTLALPQVYARDTTELKVESNYIVQWEYLHTNTDGSTSWYTIPGGSENSDTLTVDPEEYGHTYRAVVRPRNEAGNKYLLGSLVATTGAANPNTVTVTVAASADTVYQANPITLYANVITTSDTVAVPTGSVAFYYADLSESGDYSGLTVNDWKLIQDDDTTVVSDKIPLENHNGAYRAAITTSTLPVTDTTGTYRNLVFKAVYSGDNVFAGNTNLIQSEAEGITTTAPVGPTVTVYSSVVLQSSIIISHIGSLVSDGDETYLTLSDITTLDGDEAFAQLAIDSDYTVQWQQRPKNSADVNAWEKVPDSTSTHDSNITPLEEYAYRVKLTVDDDSEKVRASYTQVDGPVAGQRVYYSNTLTVGDANALINVNITPAASAALEGDDVDFDVYLYGGETTPVGAVTLTVTDEEGNEVQAFSNNTVNGHVTFTWENAPAGIYTVTTNATLNNGYVAQANVQDYIVRYTDHTLVAHNKTVIYNGQHKAYTTDDIIVDNMDPNSVGNDPYTDLETMAEEAVVFTYALQGSNGALTPVDAPVDAGTYTVTAYLPESKYWTEKTVQATLTVEKRVVTISDIVVQAKVYDGTTNANILDVTLTDAATAQDTTGLPAGDTGLISGDSVYATGTAKTNNANVAAATTVTFTPTGLAGPDAGNYKLPTTNASYSEPFTIARNQLEGEIASVTKVYTTKSGVEVAQKLAATDIYLIDQSGSAFTNYTVTYYYHDGSGVKKVDSPTKVGKYTVVALPTDTANYKGGASGTMYIAPTGSTPSNSGITGTYASTLITISNTQEVYSASGNTGITATATSGFTPVVMYYKSGSGYTDTVPTVPGRYIVKVYANTGDTAYGIYTLYKGEKKDLVPVTVNTTYGDGASNVTNMSALPTGSYVTYTGGRIVGLSYEAPTDAGTYLVTYHVPASDKYVAYETSTSFAIAKKQATISAVNRYGELFATNPRWIVAYDGLVDGDSSLKDLIAQPTIVLNPTNGENFDYNNVGGYEIEPKDAIAYNYAFKYETAELSVITEDPQEALAIVGEPAGTIYYGDEFRLSLYGSEGPLVSDIVEPVSAILANDMVDTITSNSSTIVWSITEGNDVATIDSQLGDVTIVGVGTFTVRAVRGTGAYAIYTEKTFTAAKKIIDVVIANQDYVYDSTDKYISEENFSFEVLVEGDALEKADCTITGEPQDKVGAYVVSAVVNDDLYQGTGAGLLTINRKDATVTPTADTMTYGDTPDGPEPGVGYTEAGNCASDLLLNPKAIAVSDVRSNSDVGTYEILVGSGTENNNYNITYVTPPYTNAKLAVTPRAMTITTGSIHGTTDGSYTGLPDPSGSTTNFRQNDDRMYGELNQIMDYLVSGLISGDDLADLLINDTFVSYTRTVSSPANREYLVPTNQITKDTATGLAISEDGYVISLTKPTPLNYTVTVNTGRQEIYQRPVTLTVDDLAVYYGTEWDDVEDQFNVKVGKYNGVGGLAEKLSHTVANLLLNFTCEPEYDETADNGTEYVVTTTVGNSNYWAEPETSELTLSWMMVVATIQNKTSTSFYVTTILYTMDADGNETSVQADVDGTIGYTIIDKSTNVEVRTGNLSRVSTGYYKATYSTLPAGSYTIKLIAPDGYAVISNSLGTSTGATRLANAIASNDIPFEQKDGDFVVIDDDEPPVTDPTDDEDDDTDTTTYYTVTYDDGDNGELDGKKTEQVASGKKPKNVPDIVPDEGYEFDGWYVKTDEDKELVDPEDVVIRKDTTFVAMYSAVEADEEETLEVTDDSLLNKTDHFAYMQGDSSGSFNPDKNLTRAEAAQIFYNLLKEQNAEITASFSDVPASAWYAKAVGVLASLKIINGYADGTFKPENSITRAEFATMASKFEDLSEGGKTFTDVSPSHWAYASISSASAKGWINGYADGSFRPENNIVRSEVVKIVNAVLGRSPDQAFIDGSAAIKSFPDVTKLHWAYYEIMEAVNGHDYEVVNSKEAWKAVK